MPMSRCDGGDDAAQSRRSLGAVDTDVEATTEVDGKAVAEYDPDDIDHLEVAPLQVWCTTLAPRAGVLWIPRCTHLFVGSLWAFQCARACGRAWLSYLCLGRCRRSACARVSMCYGGEQAMPRLASVGSAAASLLRLAHRLSVHRCAPSLLPPRPPLPLLQTVTARKLSEPAAASTARGGVGGAPLGRRLGTRPTRAPVGRRLSAADRSSCSSGSTPSRSLKSVKKCPPLEIFRMCTPGRCIKANCDTNAWHNDQPVVVVVGGGHTRVAHADRVARLFDLVMMNDRIFPYLLHLVINEKSPK